MLTFYFFLHLGSVLLHYWIWYLDSHPIVILSVRPKAQGHSIVNTYYLFVAVKMSARSEHVIPAFMKDTFNI